MIRFTIKGKLASMKNRRIPLRHSRGSIPNPECQAFERDFNAQVPRTAMQALGSTKRLLRAKVTVFYPSLRSDLDCAYVYDLLQKNGVVRNDRYIRLKEEQAFIDKDNPRVEIEVDYLAIEREGGQA